VTVPRDIQQIFVSTNTSDSDTLTASMSQDTSIATATEIYETTIDNLNLKPDEGIPMETDKQTNIQLLTEVSVPGSSTEPFNQTQVFDISMLDGLQQGQIITNLDQGHVLELVTGDGQTMHIKLEGIQNLLSMTSTNTSSQTE